MSTPSEISIQTTIMNRGRPIIAKATATTQDGFTIEAVGKSNFTEGRAIKSAESALETHIEDAQHPYEVINVKTGPAGVEVFEDEVRYYGSWKTVLRFGSLNSRARTIPIPPQKVKIRMYDQGRSVEGTGWGIRSLSKAVGRARNKAKKRL